METIEFDTAYSALTGEHAPGHYIPTVEHDDTADILIDGAPRRSEPDTGDSWYALTGYTRQHGYRGAVMHASETMTDDAIRAAVIDAGGDVFAIVTVEAPCGYCESGEPMEHNCEPGEPAGWAVIYRSAA